MKKDKNPNWRGGVYTHRKGYKMLLVEDHPSGQKYIMEHRLIVEKSIGRFLKPSEIVHHINGNNKDNSIENLFLCSSNAQHRKLHIIKTWSKKSHKCIECGKSNHPHEAKEMCTKCYESKRVRIR